MKVPCPCCNGNGYLLLEERCECFQPPLKFFDISEERKDSVPLPLARIRAYCLGEAIQRAEEIFYYRDLLVE